MERIQASPHRTLPRRLAGGALLLVAALFVGCASLPAAPAAPELPFKTVTEAMEQGTDTSVLMCPQGPVVGIMHRAHHGSWNLFVDAEGTRFVFVDIANERVAYGRVTPAKTFQIKESMSLAEARNRFPAPCAMLFSAGT